MSTSSSRSLTSFSDNRNLAFESVNNTPGSLLPAFALAPVPVASSNTSSDDAETDQSGADPHLGTTELPTGQASASYVYTPCRHLTLRLLIHDTGKFCMS